MKVERLIYVVIIVILLGALLWSNYEPGLGAGSTFSVGRMESEAENDRCLPIEEGTDTNIEKLFENKENLECLTYRLQTTRFHAIDPKIIKYLDTRLESGHEEERNEDFFATDAAIVSASVVSTWSRTFAGERQGVKFDYSKHRNWLIQEALQFDSWSTYAISPIFNFGTPEDQKIIINQFGKFDERAQVSIYANLALNCDQDSVGLLKEIKDDYPNWWKTKPKLALANSKCSQFD